MAPNQLSLNFWLPEFVVSQEAIRRGIDNTPTREIVENLRRLAAALEDVRTRLVAPVSISSGYRCPALNRAVGGAPNSAHMVGLAADFICPRRGEPRVIFTTIAASAIVYDQLIDEFGRWVHFAIPPLGQAPRQQLLRAVRGADGKTRYEPVSV